MVAANTFPGHSFSGEGYHIQRFCEPWGGSSRLLPLPSTFTSFPWCVQCSVTTCPASSPQQSPLAPLKHPCSSLQPSQPLDAACRVSPPSPRGIPLGLGHPQLGGRLTPWQVLAASAWVWACVWTSGPSDDIHLPGCGERQPGSSPPPCPAQQRTSLGSVSVLPADEPAREEVGDHFGSSSWHRWEEAGWRDGGQPAS